MNRSAIKHLLLPLFLIVVFAASAVAQTADEIIDKHLAALGGRAALAKITSRKSTGTVTFVTPGGEISGPFESYNKAPNKSRAYMKLDATSLGAGEMVIEQRFDGTNGYMLNSLQGDADITGNQLDNFRNGAFPTSLLTYKTVGTKAELLPKEKIGVKDAFVVRMVPKVGSPVKMFFDVETYLLMRTVTTITAQTGDIEQVSEPSDYRVVDGIKVAFQVVNSNASQTIKIRLTKVEQNVAIDDAMFGKKVGSPK